MLFHHSRAFIEKHKKHHHIIMAMVALVFASASVYVYRNELAQAATFTWTQKSTSLGGVGWTTLDATATSTHPTGQDNWAKYSATSTSIVASGSGVSLASVSGAITDDGFGVSNKTDYTTPATPRKAIVSPDGTSVYVATMGTILTKYSRNTADGTLSARVDYTALTNGGYLAISPDGTSVYVGGTNFTTPYISRFVRAPDGTLSNRVDYPALGNFGITVSSDGAFVYATRNDATGGVSVFSRAADGSLSNRIDYATGETGSFEAVISPDGGSLYVANSGSAGGNISLYTRNQVDGTLSNRIDYTAGSGPRGVVVSPDGHHVYVSNYSGSTISRFTRAPDGTLSGVVSYPTSGTNNGLAISIDGRFVLTANTSVSAVQVFARNVTDGTLSSTGTFSSGANPHTVTFSPDGKSVYSGNYGGANISHFTVGALGDSQGYARGFEYGTHSSTIVLLYGGEAKVGIPTSMSGTFTSAVIDMGRSVDYTTFNWTETLNGQSLTMKVRSSANSSMTGATSWASCSNISNGASLLPNGCVTNGHRYLQYQAYFTTATLGVTATLNSVTIHFNEYALSGNLTSSKYDSSSPGNLVNRITWIASTSTTETVKFQIRSSADGNTWSGWCGYVDAGVSCSGTNYFDDAYNGVALATTSPLRSGGDDQFFQYKIFLTSGGSATPLLTSVSVQYLVNAPPVVGNIVPLQITDSQSADYNKVRLTFDVSDPDTSGGSQAPVDNRFKVTPTLYEYSTNGGSSWTTISTGLGANAFSPITLTADGATSTAVVLWDPTGTNASVANARIRVTITDNEGANFSAIASSGNFTLDSIPPSVSAIVDSSIGATASSTIVLTATDGNTLQYRFCNNNAFPATDTQGNSCAWSVPGGNLASSSIPFLGVKDANGNETVYLQVRDFYGNTVTRTIVAPAMPANFAYKDVSSPSVGLYWEFLSWGIFQATTSSAFGAYKVYHSIDGTNYTLITTIADPATNYYRHAITTATSSTQYYKMSVVDSDGDVSDYTGVLSDVPNGQGGIDVTPPTVTNVATSSVRSNSATITWNTDELSTSEVSYGTTLGYGSTATVGSYSTAHSVTLTGLLQNTTYYFRVRSADPAVPPNTSNWVTVGSASASAFTTIGGPTIVESTDNNHPIVVPTNTSAEITWHTNVSSDSYVTYSTDPALTGGTRVGVATYVTTQDALGYVHRVTITGLTAGRTYHYQVESTDVNGTTYNKPAGTTVTHYSFNTTIDTQPPVISATSTPVLASDSTVIVWQTDELATSQVFYDTVSRAGNISQYAYRTVVEPTMSIFHVVTLSSATEKYDNIGNSLILGGNVLTPETKYYVAVRSVDAATNAASSAEWSFTTPSSGTVTIIQMGGSSKKGEVIADTSAPIISGFKISDITPFGAIVAFNTDEEAVSFAEFGKDTSYGEASGSSNYAKAHILKVRGLTLGSEYHIRPKAVDRAGNTGTGADQTFKTAFLSENLKELAQIENIEAFQKEIENTIESILPSLVPPFVSKPQVTDITDSSAKITFKTNIKSFPIVVYVEQGRYDDKKDNPYTGEVSNTENKAIEHALNLAGLKPNTKYHYQARAFSLPKVIGKSDDFTFVTKAAKIAGSIVERKKDSFTVVWTTTEPTTSTVEYKNLKTGSVDRKTDTAMKTSHSMKIENLPSGTTYSVDISGTTEAGNTVEAGSHLSVTTSTDTTAPTISGFKVDNAFIPGRADRVQTIISWLTDEPANSTVYYEEGAGTAGEVKELANKAEVTDSYVAKHSVILPNLRPGTIYRIKVVSSDDSGNRASFGPRTVITPRQTESITDIIFKNFEDSFKFLRQI